MEQHCGLGSALPLEESHMTPSLGTTVLVVVTCLNELKITGQYVKYSVNKGFLSIDPVI